MSSALELESKQRCEWTQHCRHAPPRAVSKRLRMAGTALQPVRPSPSCAARPSLTLHQAYSSRKKKEKKAWAHLDGLLQGYHGAQAWQILQGLGRAHFGPAAVGCLQPAVAQHAGQLEHGGRQPEGGGDVGHPVLRELLPARTVPRAGRSRGSKQLVVSRHSTADGAAASPGGRLLQGPPRQCCRDGAAGAWLASPPFSFLPSHSSRRIGWLAQQLPLLEGLQSQSPHLSMAASSVESTVRSQMM
jgi:hypothetical protein